MKRKPLPEEVTINVVLGRQLLELILRQAASEGRSAPQMIRERLEASVLWRIKADLASGADPKSGMRPKRPNGAIHDFRERLLIRIPLPVKCQIMKLARENSVTQDELGWIIVRAALADEAWLFHALQTAKHGG